MKPHTHAVLLIIIVGLAFLVQAFLPISPNTNNPGHMRSLDLIQKISCGQKLGTATMIDDYHALTAAHVVFPAGRCAIGGHPAKVVYANTKMDITVVEIENPLGRSLPINCDGIVTGQKYYAMGYVDRQKYFVVEPLIALKQYGFRPSDGSVPTTTLGLPRMFEGSLYHGMSGGPILNEDGEMVAISLATLTFMGLPYGFGLDLRETKLCPDDKQ